MDGELAAVLGAFATPSEVGVADARRRIQAVVGATAVPPPVGLTAVDRDVPGPPGAPAVPVRVYQPERADGARPALLYLHGGGFVAGDLDTDHERCVQFAMEAGCLVVSVDYRLAPAHPYPAALDDCFAALCWLAATRELPVDRAWIGVGGASAGAGLAAGVALLARDRRNPRLAFQLLAAPVLDDRMLTESMRSAGTPLFDGPAAARMWASYLGGRAGGTPETHYATPGRAADLRDLPPAFVMTSEMDPLRDEGIDFAARLLRSGVPVELHQYAGAFHGFERFATAISRRAMDEQIRWLRAVTARPFEGAGVASSDAG